MNCFRHFTVKKTRLPLLAERLSRLYIPWFAYKYAICEEGLWENCVFVPKFLVYRGEIKGSEIKRSIPHVREHNNSFPLVKILNVATYREN